MERTGGSHGTHWRKKEKHVKEKTEWGKPNKHCNNLCINYVEERATRINKSNWSRNRDVQNEEIQP